MSSVVLNMTGPLVGLNIQRYALIALLGDENI